MEDNTCIFCGTTVPEGTWVCPNCQKEIQGADADTKDGD